MRDLLHVLLLLGPALLLLATLLLGRYPGERTLDRLRRTRRRRSRARTSRTLGRRRGTSRVPLRGGRLVGAGTAARPPPDGAVGRRIPVAAPPVPLMS